jgi:hypothetical protein
VRTPVFEKRTAFTTGAPRSAHIKSKRRIAEPLKRGPCAEAFGENRKFKGNKQQLFFKGILKSIFKDERLKDIETNKRSLESSCTMEFKRHLNTQYVKEV